MITETTKYALRAANPWVANKPAGRWLPKGRIVMMKFQVRISWVSMDFQKYPKGLP